MMRWLLSITAFVLTVSAAVWMQTHFPDMKEAILTVLGALIALGGTWLFSVRDTEKAARYLAIRTVCVLDRFLEDCAAVAYDSGEPEFDNHGQHYMTASVETPDVPAYPNDVDWKSIPHNLMYEILSFPPDVEAAKAAITFIINEVASPPDYDEWFEERSLRYAQLGLKAHELATKLRKAYDIPNKEYDKDWQPIPRLKEKIAQIQKRQDERAKSHAEMMERAMKKSDEKQAAV